MTEVAEYFSEHDLNWNSPFQLAWLEALTIDSGKSEEGRAVPAGSIAVCHKKHVTKPHNARTSRAYFRPRKSLLAVWFSATPCIRDSERDNWVDNLEACVSCSSATKSINCG
jgi:hypothetical protein